MSVLVELATSPSRLRRRTTDLSELARGDRKATSAGHNNNNSIEVPEYIVDPETKITYLKGKFLGKDYATIMDVGVGRHFGLSCRLTAPERLLIRRTAEDEAEMLRGNFEDVTWLPDPPNVILRYSTLPDNS
ncbi:hypothetical protein HPB47_001706 [Ixodes persulcatus]|uniref:Uncharacterized protein n=1 Tax=Ixodes persulcatus TaxID=34615 RepID=A0AC60PP39_IXOPE|nr:hypothetical protein HPB47_001706 [Ixodes persulcatus]